MKELKLRNDIEGLRAVAVLAVVLFHAGLGPVSGGFLGVDVFFVVSGYLITRIVVRDVAGGGFSLLRFYQRRVARIVPALFLTVAAVLLAAMLLLLPSEVARLRGASVSAILFASNIFFWHAASYFAAPSETQPLLHSWSLGVEEQFYLLYPLLLLAGARLGGRWTRGLLLAATAASLAVAALASRLAPEAGFYLLPTRLWELGLGGLGALFPMGTGRRLRELLCAGALLALTAALVRTPSSLASPFPAGLLPCAATVLLLVLGEGSAAGRLLALPPLRAVGRVSYSFYLAHWPLLVFWRTQFGYDLPRTARIGLVLGAFAIAVVSYVVVERPLRRRLREVRPLPVVAGAAVAALALAAFAAATTMGQWQLRRWPSAVLRLLDTRGQHIAEASALHDPSCRTDPKPPKVACLAVLPGMRNVLIAGDSHAAHLILPMVERFRDRHFLVAMQIGCTPLFRGGESRIGCHAAALRGLDRAMAVPLDGVVLAARWQPEDIPALIDTVATLRRRAIAVTVVGPAVEYYPMVPELLARAVAIGNRSWIDRARSLDRERLDAQMGPRVRAAGAAYFSPYREECPPARPCRLFTRTGRPFHFDYGHYTRDAAREIVAAMPPP